MHERGLVQSGEKKSFLFFEKPKEEKTYKALNY